MTAPATDRQVHAQSSDGSRRIVQDLADRTWSLEYSGGSAVRLESEYAAARAAARIVFDGGEVVRGLRGGIAFDRNMDRDLRALLRAASSDPRWRRPAPDQDDLALAS